MVLPLADEPLDVHAWGGRNVDELEADARAIAAAGRIRHGGDMPHDLTAPREPIGANTSLAESEANDTQGLQARRLETGAPRGRLLRPDLDGRKVPAIGRRCRVVHLDYTGGVDGVGQPLNP